MASLEAVTITQDVDLHRAGPEEFAALVRMYESFEPKGACMGLPPRKEPERWLRDLSQYPNFIVMDGERIVAHAALCPEGETAEVAVFVHQDYRGQGLGKRLLRALIEEARRLNLKRVWGMTEWDNVPMLRLARALGFTSAADPREFFLDVK
jgi:RimJ/RimL family protein N-acetyltransferase